MSQLNEVQARVSSAILTGDLARAAALVSPGRMTGEQALQVYRNNHVITLTDALSATYSVTRRLLGEACFRSIAKRFVLQRPPADPRLFAYGRKFPDFLVRQSVLAGHPYVPDVARLEWAMNDASHAPDVAPVPMRRTAALPIEKLGRLTAALHPACQLVFSRYPVDDIWRAHHRGDDALAALDPSPRATRLVVMRDAEGDVVWRSATAAEFAFLRAIRAGRTLLFACETALEIDARFDPARVFADLVAAGLFTDLDLI